jgi:predicted transposase YbfD/YdcC
VNHDHVTTLTQAIPLLKEFADPRCRRGRRYEWWVLLSTVLAALLAGCDHFRAMAQWAANHSELLAEYLPLRGGRAPSECTLQRALRQVDLVVLSQLLNRVQEARTPAAVLEPVALDGKALRAASSAQAPLHLLELARHGDGAVLGLCAVGGKQNEYSASPVLLAGIDLTNRVVTGDALFCQRKLTDYVAAKGGWWLLAVKENQPNLLRTITDHFAAPRSGPHALDIREERTTGRAHGRIERRVLEVSADLAGHLDWPGAAQVIRRTMVRTVDGRDSLEHSYWVTSLSPEQADAKLLERFCRGHWTIENQVHWTRDVTFGEDRCTARGPRAPLALALLRSFVRWLILYRGRFQLVTDGRRHYRCYPGAALELLGAGRL